MKSILSGLFMAVLGSNAFATVDGHDRVYLVVKDIQSEEFFLERARLLAATVLRKGLSLCSLRAEYKVNSNIGCGGETFQDNSII